MGDQYAAERFDMEELFGHVAQESIDLIAAHHARVAMEVLPEAVTSRKQLTRTQVQAVYGSLFEQDHRSTWPRRCARWDARAGIDCK